MIRLNKNKLLYLHKKQCMRINNNSVLLLIIHSVCMIQIYDSMMPS